MRSRTVGLRAFVFVLIAGALYALTGSAPGQKVQIQRPLTQKAGEVTARLGVILNKVPFWTDRKSAVVGESLHIYSLFEDFDVATVAACLGGIAGSLEIDKAASKPRELLAKITANARSGVLSIVKGQTTVTSRSRVEIFPSNEKASPEIASLTPRQLERAETLTILGKGLDWGQGRVEFMGTTIVNQTGRTVEHTPTKLVVLVPPGAYPGAAKLTLYRSSTKVKHFDLGEIKVELPPFVQSFSPAWGVSPFRVTLKGFNLSKPGRTYRIGEVLANFQRNYYEGETDAKGAVETVEIGIPAGAKTGPITVITEEGRCTTGESLYVCEGGGSGLKIESFSPAAGKKGEAVTLQVSGLVNSRAGKDLVLVKFGLSLPGEPSQVSPPVIRVRVPEDGTSGPITIVSCKGEAKSSQPFWLPPEAGYVSPEAGYEGMLIRVYGYDLFLSTAGSSAPIPETNVVVGGKTARIRSHGVGAEGVLYVEAEVPSGLRAGTTPVWVETPGGKSAQLSFTVKK